MIERFSKIVLLVPRKEVEMSVQKNIRYPAVSGRFYPRDPDQLRQAVEQYIQAAEPVDIAPTALVAPHAGYMYSGPVAGSAYACLRAHPAGFRRVVIIGPAHRVPVDGIAGVSVSAFATPLGNVPVDQEAQARVLDRPGVRVWDEAHREEHGLEVHLPFLQVVLTDFTLVPLVVGVAAPKLVAGVLSDLVDPHTLLLISSDLSHFYDYPTARKLDAATAAAIEQGEILAAEQACGRVAINGLTLLAGDKDWRARTLDLRNSGDTAGPRDRVVGYGAFVYSA